MENKIDYLFEHPDFEDLLQQTATNLYMPFDFIEKDYWVTYMLYRMQKAGIHDFVFKGGTSLTKGWDLLDRFSEDIDLLFYPSDISKSAKRTRLKKVTDTISSFSGVRLNLDSSENHGHYRVNSYDYEKRQNSNNSPLLNHIKLEMGFRGNADSKIQMDIQSYIGKELEKANQSHLAEDIRSFQISVLDITRTFVEKLFAINTAYENNEITKYYRHYYDVYKLIKRPDIIDYYSSQDFQTDVENVAILSKENFPNTVVPLNNDFKQSNAFKNSEVLSNELGKVLKQQSSLFFKTPPSGEEILAKIESFIFKKT